MEQIRLINLEDEKPTVKQAMDRLETRKLLQLCPDFRKDHDINRHNNGITVVVLRDRKG